MDCLWFVGTLRSVRFCWLKCVWYSGMDWLQLSLMQFPWEGFISLIGMEG